MSDQSLRFRLPGAAWSLEIPTDGLAVLKSHVQRGWLKREVVGQLFARDLTAEIVVVEVVTRLSGPRSPVLVSTCKPRRPNGNGFSSKVFTVLGFGIRTQNQFLTRLELTYRWPPTMPMPQRVFSPGSCS